MYVWSKAPVPGHLAHKRNELQTQRYCVAHLGKLYTMHPRIPENDYVLFTGHKKLQ